MSLYDFLEEEEEEYPCIGSVYERATPDSHCMHRLPNGKLVNLRLYTMPLGDAEGSIPEKLEPAPIHRPVTIERVGQLMFLFVKGRYIDVFVVPAAMYDVQLSTEQRARIVCALAA
jgi:hypothetical protein